MTKTPDLFPSILVIVAVICIVASFIIAGSQDSTGPLPSCDAHLVRMSVYPPNSPVNITAISAGGTTTGTTENGSATMTLCSNWKYRFVVSGWSFFEPSFYPVESEYVFSHGTMTTTQTTSPIYPPSYCDTHTATLLIDPPESNVTISIAESWPQHKEPVNVTTGKGGIASVDICPGWEYEASWKNVKNETFYPTGSRYILSEYGVTTDTRGWM